MLEIINSKIEFYNENLASSDARIRRELAEISVQVLDGFIEQGSLVRQFFERFYRETINPVVLVGINPGRFGSGKTGIPLTDFNILSRYFDVNSEGIEKSAQFFFKVVDHFGVEPFFRKVYVTNMSWFGFTKGRKNYNYFSMPIELQSSFTTGFIEEMNIVRPTIIIPLSQKVRDTLISMQISGQMRYQIDECLNHPLYCSFPSRENQQKYLYIERLTSYF